MKKHEITVRGGYNPKTQQKVGLFAAQLDDQLKRLKNNVKELTVRQLQWQERPGLNTVGMLLAHLALVEVWWIKLAPNEVRWDPDARTMISKICGFEDDGLPLPQNGKHPKYLHGYTLEDYLRVLTKVRRATHRELKGWRDRDLDKMYSLGKRQISRTWTLYHVLEHFAAHFGQILMLKHMMRDARVLRVEKK